MHLAEEGQGLGKMASVVLRQRHAQELPIIVAALGLRHRRDRDAECRHEGEHEAQDSKCLGDPCKSTRAASAVSNFTS